MGCTSEARLRCVASCGASRSNRSLRSCRRQMWCWRHAAARTTGAARCRHSGHRVRLIPPQYVKPFVKRGKNDRIDAAAISEAAGRPAMSFVPVKSAEQQAEAMVLSVRELLVKQHTQLVNALRGHAAEFGVIAAQRHRPRRGAAGADRWRSAVPAAAQAMFVELGERISELDDAAGGHRSQARDAAQDQPGQPTARGGAGDRADHRADAGDDSGCRAVPVGRGTSPPGSGLTPKQNSTGGKTRLGGISRQGNERLRHCWCSAPPSVVRLAKPGHRSGPSRGCWACCSARPTQGRGGGPGQQDGPCRVGHDDERRSLPAPAGDGLRDSSPRVKGR